MAKRSQHGVVAGIAFVVVIVDRIHGGVKWDAEGVRIDVQVLLGDHVAAGAALIAERRHPGVGDLGLRTERVVIGVLGGDAGREGSDGESSRGRQSGGVVTYDSVGV